MFDWRYWRWETIRNAPLAVVVALLIAVCGWSALNAIPPKNTASARVVLERKIGMASKSKVQRTSDEVQHLQVVVHALRATMNAVNLSAELAENGETFDLKVESSRDKPTYLIVQSTMQSSIAAIALVNSLATRAIGVSNATQQAQTDSSLSKLRAELAESKNRLSLARESLSAHLSKAPTIQINDLRERTSQLRAELLAESTGLLTNTPALEKLYGDLTTARGLYSDIHPKVRLIQTRIERARSKSRAGRQNKGLQQQLQDLEARMIAGKVFQETSHQLEQEIATATAATESAQDTLSITERTSEASRMQLKIVQDAALTGRSQEKVRAWLLATIIFASLLAAIGAVAIRVRFDRYLRRPRDLHHALGLTPFATLPDLGPSLG